MASPLFGMVCSAAQSADATGFVQVKHGQSRFAVGSTDVTEIKFAMMKHRARVVEPGPSAVRRERGEVRLGWSSKRTEQDHVDLAEADERKNDSSLHVVQRFPYIRFKPKDQPPVWVRRSAGGAPEL